MPDIILDSINAHTPILIYIALVSLISIVVTAIDKANAIDGERRVRERTLLLLSAAGGSVAMLGTMLVIRHKTKHLKFMIGIPSIIVLQSAVLFALHYFEILG